MEQRPEDEQLRSAALQTSQSVRSARQRAEEELLQAKDALEAKTGQLAHSLSMMRATLDSTTDGILAVDERGRITEYNEQFATLWQIPKEEPASRDREALLEVAAKLLKNPDEFLARTRAIYAAADRESVDVLEFEDGRVIERRSKIQRIGDRVVGRVWSYRDITERIRAEETLRDEASILELLNKTGRAIAAQLDLQTVLQIVTDSATELTGASYGSFYYASPREGEGGFTFSGAPGQIFERFGDLRSTALFRRTFAGEGPIRSDDILKDARYGPLSPPEGLKKGHLEVCSYLAMPVISSSGDVIGGLFFGHPDRAVFTQRADRMIIGVAAQAAIAIDNARLYSAAQREIAERKRAEAERERLFVSETEARERAENETRMKDEFLATVSHELRTPLNAILGWANILRTTDNADDIPEGLKVIERNARAQARIIEDLLDMSRIISGKVRLDIQQIDLVPVIKTAIESASPMAAAKNIRITSEIDPRAGTISGDPARVQQILWNLLTNALKFTPKGGSVHVVSEHVESSVAIRVSDSGIGIAADFLPHVFGRFRQADASTTRHHSGLGLGLAIVKNLVELHGGAVRADSPGASQGSTFTITLPIVAVFQSTSDLRRACPDREAEPRNTNADLGGLRVLTVDDELDAREMVKRILRERGAVVETAPSSAAALALFQLVRPHVLITDIGMPEEDGYTFIRKVRELSSHDGGAVPAIALTALARAEDRERALASGFQTHLAKPVEPAELVATVANLAGRPLGHPEFNYD